MRSHFLPMIRRAKLDGYRVVVAARHSAAQEDLRAAGAETVLWFGDRTQRSIGSMLGRQQRLADLIRSLQPDLVHAIALTPSLMSGLCPGRHRLIFAITGFGFLAAEAAQRRSRKAQLWSLAAGIGTLAQVRQAVLLFENQTDLGLVQRFYGSASRRSFVLPGAGINPDHFTPQPLPGDETPFRVGIAARLVHTKGIEDAVAAVGLVRQQGQAIELLIAGEPDPGNPASYTLADLARWTATPGVRLLGRVDDVRSLWRQVHLALLPSWGGEGLPRSLLEAAACGRAIVTTDVPGCKDFVDHGVSGWLVPRRDVSALAACLMAAAGCRDRVANFGAAARAKVNAGYTELHVADAVSAAWAMALGQARR